MARFSVVLAIIGHLWLGGVTPLQSANGVSDTLHVSVNMPGKDSFWGQDKQQHFVGSLVHTVFWGAYLQQQQRWPKSSAMLWAGGISVSLGIAKEIRDAHQSGNHFCWKDLLADVLGITVGLVLINQP